ncbi:tubulin tyrosine ligase-related [Schistosoma mansoni]|uniref:tubulin tyrosine ligase-related n=1 Tax=Schistosoma mansoni TaxID=6183 RepID=UPI0001A61F74|nr:tubulin tyrosine ligase-related [Schistosoma mansoni]|eukprot:XP_018648293.1 tubulin tyrosine ligase-related [Schistosoma mansoni]
MTELGWKRTFDRHADYTLRWTENSIQINYGIFKEGEQLVNHIPNCGLLTNKLGLLISLRDYERRYQNRFGRLPIMVMDDFFPKTFIVDDLKEREAYFKLQETPHMWICKPIGQNQGKGIFLVRDIEEFKVHLKNRDEEARHQPSGLLPRIIQRYIINPLLLDGCKFDIRCYVLIACTMPYLVFYHPGYIRRSAKPYSNQDQNLITHLTNQFVQKKDPAYAEVKNNTVWSWSQVNDYINKHYREEKKLPVDWTKTVLQWRIQRIIHHVFTTVKNRLAAKVGFFELLGLDFMLDENMKVWLLEVNSNPALQTHCDVLKEVVPVVVKDALHISIECFEKSRHQKCLLPLHGLDNLSAFVFCQRSNRHMRTSLDEMPIVNKISGDLGVPTGWNLLYNESQAAFRARWPILQSCSLRCWIPPRYKPPTIHNNPNLQRPVNDNNTEQNKSNSVSLQTCGSTAATNENVNMLGHTTDVVNCTSKEQNTSKNTISNQLFHPRLSLPEYRTFESSLRRYPVTSNTMNNKILPRRNTLARQSLQDSKQTIHLQDISEKIPQPESFITSKHDLEVFSEDEILTGKRKAKTKLNLISISREPVQISRVHLITNSDIDKNQSTIIGGTSADHIYDNIDNIQNKSKLIGRPYASSNKLHTIESNDLITVTYETKKFTNKSQNIHYSSEDRGS